MLILSITKTFTHFKPDLQQQFYFFTFFIIKKLYSCSVVLRGGTGVFTGRVPFAWFGYAYYNNGVNFNSVDANGIQASPITTRNANGTTTTVTPNQVIRLNQDPTQIYNQLTQTTVVRDAQGNVVSTATAPYAYNPANPKAGPTEVNLIDNDFKMPQVWRSSLALDYKLKTGTRFSVEGLYTKTLQDVKFENINLTDNVSYLSQGPTESPRYSAPAGGSAKVNTGFSNAFFLTNTQKGYRYQLTGSVGQTINNLIDASVAYTYGKIYDISNGIRNSPQSNWELNPARNVNDPALALSNFDLRHRVVASINLHKTFAERFTGYFTSVLTYQSGSPFTYVYNNNPFGNGQQNVQMAYVPSDANDILLTDIKKNGVVTVTADQQRQQLNDFINNDSYLSSRRGQYTERNAARTPWNNQADVRFMLETKLGNLAPDATGIVVAGHTIQISLDIINVGNLLNKNWGRQYFVPNTFNSTAGFGLNQSGFVPSADDASKKSPTFTYTAPAGGFTPYSIDQLASRWQGQLGLRYSF